MQSGSPMFDGKVVLVTGAGGGIGRSHVLAFAKEGAKVVVNDVGGSREGGGADAKMADAVVAEVKAMGGAAVAHYDSIATMEGAQSLIDTAVNAFGRVDVLVNNAGILRDKTLLKMDEGMWDAVIAVHLKGTFACMQVFARRLVEEEHGGRIINTTSYAGLKGNFGQANYGAAKAGIYGLTMTAAMELRKKGITVNEVAPMAKTRMTTDVDMIPEEMTADQISPLVVYLASEQAADITGKTFGVHGQQIFLYEMKMYEGVTKAGKEYWSVAEIGERIDEIMADDSKKAAASVAAPVVAAPVDPVSEAFSMVPLAFVSEKAGSKKFNIFFDLKGGPPHSIVLEDGKLRVEAGKVETPSCTVKADADTMVGVFTGKIKAESAFMQGKISATNLADMMTMGQVLSFKKAKEELAKRQAAAPKPAPAVSAAPAMDPVSEAFSMVPLAFVPAKASGKKFNIFFDLKGGPAHSIILEDGKLRVEAGKVETPSCTVKAAADTMVGVFSGKIKAESAFMQGKISATNLADMMTMGQVLSFKQAKEALAKRQAAAPGPSAAAPAVATDPVSEAFSMVPLAFVPEKAGGKKFNIFFDLKGGTPHSIVLDGGKLRVEKGQIDTPSCTVKADADTMVGVFSGKIKAESAFMQGKISATNLADMMTMGQVLSFKKAKEELAKRQAAAPAAASTPAASPGTDPVDVAFTTLPEGFKKDKAGSWKSTIHFEIKGATDRTVVVGDGAAIVEAGLQGTADCVIRTDAETIAGLLSGKVDGQKAYMQGKITATSLSVLMKFSQFFVFEERSPAPAETVPEKSTNRADFIGRKYDGGHVFAKQEHMLQYAKAVNADNPAYLDTAREGGVVAHPIFPVRLLNDCLYQVATDPDLELDLVRLVHGEQDMHFLEPIHANDLLNLRAEVVNVEEKDSGTTVNARVYAYKDGRLTVDTLSTLFIRARARKRGPDEKKASKSKVTESLRGERPLVLNETFTVDADQASRYADASLDRNPIHLDEKVARGAGLPGVILHGLCTMAMSAGPFVTKLAEGEPTRLKRFSVRFSKPVLPGDSLTVEAWLLDETDDGVTHYGFEVKNQQGMTVVSNGLADIV